MGSPALYPYADSPHKWLLLFWRCVLHFYHGVESILPQTFHLTCNVIFSFESTWSIILFAFTGSLSGQCPASHDLCPSCPGQLFLSPACKQKYPVALFAQWSALTWVIEITELMVEIYLTYCGADAYRLGLEPGAHTCSLQQHSSGRMDCVLN